MVSPWQSRSLSPLTSVLTSQGVRGRGARHKGSTDWRLSIFTTQLTHLTPRHTLRRNTESIRSQKLAGNINIHCQENYSLSTWICNPRPNSMVAKYFFLNTQFDFIEVQCVTRKNIQYSSDLVSPASYQHWSAMSLSIFGDISSKHLIWFWWIQMNFHSVNGYNRPSFVGNSRIDFPCDDYYAPDASGTKVKRTENWRNLVLMREPRGKYQKLLWTLILRHVVII